MHKQCLQTIASLLAAMLLGRRLQPRVHQPRPLQGSAHGCSGYKGTSGKVPDPTAPEQHAMCLKAQHSNGSQPQGDRMACLNQAKVSLHLVALFSMDVEMQRPDKLVMMMLPPRLQHSRQDNCASRTV